MRRIIDALNTPIGDNRLDAQMGAAAAFLCALIVLLVGLRKVTSVAGSDLELLLGTLLVFTLSTLLVVLGFMAGVSVQSRR